jgi:hypothetical protein
MVAPQKKTARANSIRWAVKSDFSYATGVGLMPLTPGKPHDRENAA